MQAFRRWIEATVATLDPSAPPPDIVGWAASNVYLSPRVTHAPGHYSAAYTPYISDVLRAMVDPSVRECALLFGAQCGKSQALVVALCYLWRFAPGATLFVQPADDEAAAFGNKRIKPVLEDSESLRRLIPANRKKLFKAQEYDLIPCNVFLRGAGAPSALASWAIRYCVTDETDKFPPAFTTEGDPVELIRQRLKTYRGKSKYISTSTPTTDKGVIYRQFLDGDRREFFVQCEHCGAWQPLTFKDVKFDNAPDATPVELSRTARLECRTCRARYSTADKNRLVRSGEWRATAAPRLDGAVSFRLESIASPWVTLEYLVESFIKAKRAGKSALRVFVNSELAEPWIDADDNLENVRLQALEADYAPGESFPGEEGEDRVRVAGVDVQKDYLVFVAREFAMGGASGQIAHKRLATFAELAALVEEYGVDLCCIDSRFRSDEVFAACARYDYFQPCQGAFLRDGILWRKATRTVTLGRAGGKGTLTHITYDQSALFDYVAQGLRGERRWLLPYGTSADLQYVNEVTAKRLIAGRWSAPEKTADHYADAEKLCMLAALLLGYLIPQEPDPAPDPAPAAGSPARRRPPRPRTRPPQAPRAPKKARKSPP